MNRAQLRRVILRMEKQLDKLTGQLGSTAEMLTDDTTVYEHRLAVDAWYILNTLSDALRYPPNHDFRPKNTHDMKVVAPFVPLPRKGGR